MRQLFVLSALLASLVLCTGQAWADSWQHAVSTRVATEYETNPAMSPTQKDGLWRALFEPGYTLIGQSGANELKAGLSLKIARSSNKTQSVDREDPGIFMGWQRQSEMGEFGISAKYDEVATRSTETDATNLILIDGTRASRAVSANWSKSLSERSTLSVDGTNEDVSYDSGAYVNYTTQSGNLNFNYALSEHSASFLMLSGVKYRPDGDSPSSRFASATLGLNWKIESLDLTVQVGQSKRTGSNTALQGALAVRHTGQRTQLALDADRRTSSSGLGGFIKTDQVKGSWSYALSDNSRTGINMGWLKNRSITDDVSRTTDIWMQRDLTSFWGVRTYYLRKTRDADGIGSATSDMLGVALIYNHSNF